MRGLKAKFPGVPVVTYVNTYADVKAESDICCTSSNAAAVVDLLHADTVIFLPDEYLAKNVARETGKHIIFPSAGPQAGEAEAAKLPEELDYQLIGWRGQVRGPREIYAQGYRDCAGTVSGCGHPGTS